MTAIRDVESSILGFEATTEKPVTESTLTAADHTWFRLQEAANPMASLAVLFFSQALPIDNLKALVEDRLMSHERFRQKILPSRLPRARPRWHEGDDFALDNHLFRATLSPEGTARDLESLIGRLERAPEGAGTDLTLDFDFGLKAGRATEAA